MTSTSMAAPMQAHKQKTSAAHAARPAGSEAEHGDADGHGREMMEVLDGEEPHEQDLETERGGGKEEDGE
jgi:hypothetical protein